MAISTYGVYLMKGSAATPPVYTKLVDIKGYPDLDSAPELLDTTTLSDAMRTYILGIKDPAGGSGLQFPANYTYADYTALKALEGVETPYAIYFGHDSGGTPDGHDGKWEFKGMLSVGVSAGNVNEVANMTITIAPTTEMSFS